jgi:hypothetical protein
VDVDLHIADVVSVLDVEDLEDAVPLGHSYAGIVTRGDADRRGERLGTVVWRESSPVPDGDGRSSTSRPSSGRASSVTFANADTVGAGRSSTASRSPRGLRQRRRAWRATSTCADRVPETA